MSFIKISKDMYIKAEEVCAIEIIDEKSCRLRVEDDWYDCSMSAESAKKILDMDNGGIKSILKDIRRNQSTFVG